MIDGDACGCGSGVCRRPGQRSGLVREHRLRRLGDRAAAAHRVTGRLHRQLPPLAYTYEITEFVPAERLVMRIAQGPFPMETTYTWQALDDGSTRRTLRAASRPAS